MAFLIVVIADYFGSVSVKLGRICYINTNSKSIEVCFFLKLVLTIVILLAFLIIFIRNFGSILRAKKVI